MLDRRQRLRQRVRRREGVGPVQRWVDDVHRLVCAHRQGLADRLDRLVRAHREHGDLAAALGLFDLQGLFDGVLVELVHHTVDAFAVDGLVGAEFLLGPRVGDLLHADDDVHGRRPTSRSENTAWVIAWTLLIA